MAHETRSELARLIAEVTPADLTMSFFTNGGAEANENAIKLARWHTGRHKIIARYRSYHGATAGAISATGDPRRWVAEAAIPRVVRMLDPYTSRGPAERGRGDDGDDRRDERRHRPARRLSPGGPRGVRPARDPADPRRGDGGLRPHRQVVRLRALGRRAGHPHRREGDQLRLRAA